MVCGIRDADQRRLRSEGRVVKTLISYGSSWYKWYMRRLAERPANVWFVVRSMLPGERPRAFLTRRPFRSEDADQLREFAVQVVHAAAGGAAGECVVCGEVDAAGVTTASIPNTPAA